jgi:branched-chain amino acid transport system ATP-binding protein
VIVDKNHAAVTATTSRSMILVKGQVVFDGASDELRARSDLIRQHLGV